ncbi:MAG: hypothetical protein ABSH22_07560 [Tepidisphaeraceae bacterium]|jgi:hypothetical protein
MKRIGRLLSSALVMLSAPLFVMTLALWVSPCHDHVLCLCWGISRTQLFAICQTDDRRLQISYEYDHSPRPSSRSILNRDDTWAGGWDLFGSPVAPEIYPMGFGYWYLSDLRHSANRLGQFTVTFPYWLPALMFLVFPATEIMRTRRIIRAELISQ